MHILTNEQYDLMKYYYCNNIKTNKEISKEFNISDKVIYRLKKKFNWKSLLKKKYISTNIDYFEKIDSKNKAYFLGLIVADGSVSSDGLTIGLTYEDSYILYKFKTSINYSGNIRRAVFNITNRLDQGIISIYSKKLVRDLSLLGVIPNKSFKTYFPDIPEEFYSHFIRGVFDGDGCIRVDKRSNNLMFGIVGYKLFIKEIQNILIKQCNLKLIKLSHCKSNKKDTMGFEYSGNKQVKRIYEYLYKDCEDLYLTRKKEKFEQYL